MVLLLLVLLPQLGAGGFNPLGWLFTAASAITTLLTGV